MRRLRVLVLAIVALPGLAFASPKTLSDLANMVASLIDTAVFVLITFGLVVYFYGMGMNMANFSKDREKRRSFFIWGILAIFVMVSIWGIVAILRQTLFGNTTNVNTKSSSIQIPYESLV